MMYLGKDAIGLATSIPEFSQIAKIECGNYTPTTDQVAMDTRVPHSLGVVPDFVIYFADEIELPDENTQYVYMVCGTMMKRKIINELYDARMHITRLNTVEPYISNAGGNAVLSDYHSDTDFVFFAPSSTYLKANITYHYVLGKFKEVTSNANE